ncbi:MAG TPA: hypothetical protein ENI23_14620 [bacterium]|nr:hypothetical protein [bacterium]
MGKKEEFRTSDGTRFMKEETKDEWLEKENKKEESLSSKIRGNALYPYEVKEAVRDLLRWPCPCQDCVMWRERIKNRFGDKLT